MLLHSKYTDYKIIYKDKVFEELEHITNSNRIIYIWYYESGAIYNEKWLLNGKFYREDGPAIIYYNIFNNVTSQKFILNNIVYTYNDFIQTPEYQAYLKRKFTDIFD